MQTNWFGSMLGTFLGSARNARMLIWVVVGVTPSFSRRLPEEGVDEGALAGVEFTDDDEQEEFVELLDGSTQRLPVFVGGAELNQGDSQIVQELAL